MKGTVNLLEVVEAPSGHGGIFRGQKRFPPLISTQLK